MGNVLVNTIFKQVLKKGILLVIIGDTITDRPSTRASSSRVDGRIESVTLQSGVTLRSDE